MINCKNCGAPMEENARFCARCGARAASEYSYQIPAAAKTPPKAPLRTEKRDALFVLLSFAVGFAFSECILFGGLGMAVVIFFAVFYAAAAAYLSRRHRVFSRMGALTFLPVLLTLLCFALYDNMALRAFNVLALWIFTCLNLTAMAGLESRPLFWAGSWFDVLKVTFYMPFRHFSACAGVLSATGNSSRRKTAAKILLTLLVISPAVLFVLMLLARSDAGFERLLNTVSNCLTAQMWQYVMKILFAVLLTFPVFSLLYSLRYGKRPENHPLEGFMLRLGALDTVVTSVALAAFSLIYVFYIALQAD